MGLKKQTLAFKIQALRVVTHHLEPEQLKVLLPVP